MTIWSPSVSPTFNVEIHGLADVSPDVVADSTQVEAAVLLQHVLDEERAVDQHLDSKAGVEQNGLELRDSCTWKEYNTVLSTACISAVGQLQSQLWIIAGWCGLQRRTTHTPILELWFLKIFCYTTLFAFMNIN